MTADAELTARLQEVAERFRREVLAEYVAVIESPAGVVLELVWGDETRDRVGCPRPAAELADWLDVALEGVGWLWEGLMNYMNYPDTESVVLLLDGIREEEDWYREREGPHGT